MNIWVILMWVIASLMACWSFSLFVRWVSEAVARKRKRLTSQRSTKSFWLGLVLMVVCAGVAVFAGYMAVYLEGLFTSRNVKWTTPIAIIGGSVGVFGIFLLILGIIGDRARGRVRCPKCWYDMSNAVDLQCPECGHWAKSEAQFGRTRRRRWAMAIGIVLVVAGGYPVVLNKKTVKYGPLAMMPTWVLMNWWEILPEGWIVSSIGSRDLASLQYRLSPEWMSPRRIERFGNSLVKPMATSKAARWESRRIQLLIEALPPWRSKEQRKNGEPATKPDDIDLGKLLEHLAFDQLEALTVESPTDLDITILERTVQRRFNTKYMLNTYELVRYWIVGEEDREKTFGYNGIRIHLLDDSPVREHLVEFASALKEADLSESLLSENQAAELSSFRLVTDTNSLADYFDMYVRAPIPQDYPSFSKLQSRITYACLVVMDESKDEIYAMLNDWLDDDNHRRVALGIGVTLGFQRILKLDRTSTDEHYQQIASRIFDEALDDPRILYPDGFYTTQSVNQYAQRLFIRHTNDPVGNILFPMIRDWLERDGHAAWISDTYKTPSEETIGLWLDSFEMFANDPDPITRRWVIHNLPATTGTVYDDRLNKIVLDLLDDSNSRVARGAKVMMRVRKINPWQAD
jgi:hypothetical protein